MSLCFICSTFIILLIFPEIRVYLVGKYFGVRLIYRAEICLLFVFILKKKWISPITVFEIKN